MADTKISNLMQATSGVGTDEFAINEAGVSKKITLSQVAQFTNISGIVVSLMDDAIANGLTTAVKVSGMDVVVDAGTYVFEYYIRAQFADAGNSPKFAVNHTGTTTSFMYDFFFPSAGVTASTGSIDQEANATTGQIWAFQATRIINTLLGPETDIDTINEDILFRITGLMIVTITGTLELYQASEVAGNLITIKAGTCLILTKVG
jgi:hypothetical protein